MTITEMWLCIGGGAGFLILLFSLIKVKPLEINLWSWILRKIGKAFQGDLLDEFKSVNGKVDKLEEKIDALDSRLTEQSHKNEEEWILDARRNILIFSDEIYNGVYHSREHFEEILSMIDMYEDYCDEHPNFENNKALVAIQRVKDVYKDCLDNHKFK